MADDDLSTLVAAVHSSAKYRTISPDLVAWIGTRELKVRKSLKMAEKETRSKIHQVATSYISKPLDYIGFTDQLSTLSKDPSHVELKPFCERVMRQHASTMERLPILESFYQEIFSRLPPVHSIIDLGCGLNPLALPWMKASPGVRYLAIDLFQDMMDFIRTLFYKIGIKGTVRTQNLVDRIPTEPSDLAFLLKLIPCLEQLDKNIGIKLLENIPANHLVVSFPVASLSGRNRGMLQNYEQHFHTLCEGHDWKIEKIGFSSELVFIVHK
jgi:16S rRNA (guanine(1405)-N(7))-methyltransferase